MYLYYFNIDILSVIDVYVYVLLFIMYYNSFCCFNSLNQLFMICFVTSYDNLLYLTQLHPLKFLIFLYLMTGFVCYRMVKQHTILLVITAIDSLNDNAWIMKIILVLKLKLELYWILHANLIMILTFDHDIFSF